MQCNRYFLIDETRHRSLTELLQVEKFGKRCMLTEDKYLVEYGLSKHTHHFTAIHTENNNEPLQLCVKH